MIAVRQTLRKPSTKLPRIVHPHTAWIRGRLRSLGALTPAEGEAVLARCSDRARTAFRLGTSSTGPQVYTPQELDEVLDLLEVIEAAPCYCAERGLWAGTPKSRRRHAVACPRWTAPAVAQPA